MTVTLAMRFCTVSFTVTRRPFQSFSVSFAMSSPIFLGDRPSGPGQTEVSGARAGGGGGGAHQSWGRATKPRRPHRPARARTRRCSPRHRTWEPVRQQRVSSAIRARRGPAEGGGGRRRAICCSFCPQPAGSLARPRRLAAGTHHDGFLSVWKGCSNTRVRIEQQRGIFPTRHLRVRPHSGVVDRASPGSALARMAAAGEFKQGSLSADDVNFLVYRYLQESGARRPLQRAPLHPARAPP